MSKADSDFDAWLSTGLKKLVTTDDDFTRSVIIKLRQQEAVRTLKQIQLQKRIWATSIWAVLLGGLSVFMISGKGAGIYAFLQTLLGDLIQLILEPTLTGIIIPAGVVITAAAVVWNLIDMISLE